MYDDEDDDYEDDDYGTIQCPICGTDVFEDSPRCPSCGEYITNASNLANKPTWVRVFFIVIVVLIILSFVLPSILGMV